VALLIGAVWVLAFAILLIAYGMMIHERRREFAVLRLLGAARGRLCRLMLAESGLNPEETLFIDDSEANCKAAQEVGIRTVHYHIGEDLKKIFE
jgi:hypothetical protein